MTNGTYIATVAALALIPLAVGCGGNEGLGTVTGVVTIDGARAESGQISIFPLDESASPVGAKIVGGEYTVEAPLGKAKVEVRVPRVVGEKRLYNTPDSPVRKIFAESLPDKYNNESELQIEVLDGENEQNFDLSTSK